MCDRMAAKKAATATAPLSSLLQAFAEAGEPELAEVDQQIDKLEAELETLRVIRRAIDIRLHGKQKRRSPTKKRDQKPSSDDASIAGKVHDYIFKHGPALAGVIAKSLGCSPQAVGVAAKQSGWFEQDPIHKTWHIAEAADARAFDDE